MPSGSQDLEWFMCAGMLREVDLRLEESKRPSFRIDLLSKQITKRAGIWWRESLLKGTVSFVSPSGLLRLDAQFKKELGWDLPFSRAGFPLWKVPIATCTACLTVINRVYRITVNHPLSFVLSNKCAKNNASVKFCVYMEMKCVCLTLHSEGLMFLVPVNTIAAAMWVLSCRSFGFSAVTRTSAASRSDGGGGWGGVLWSVHSNLYFFPFFALCG